MTAAGEKHRLFPSQRLLLALMGFLGCFVVYAQRVDLSVTLICMVNQTASADPPTPDLPTNATAAPSECQASQAAAKALANDGPPSLGKQGSFVWDKDKQGLILSSFFWGYLLTQVAGGWAAQRFGCRLVFGGTVGLATVLTFVTPLVARMSWGALVGLRIVLGMVQGATFPIVLVLWSNWAPPLERSSLTSITFAGCQMGNVVTLPLAGVLCDHGFDGGWPSVFYTLGLVGAVWCVGWWVVARDSPEESPLLSLAEQRYIVGALRERKESITEAERKAPMPWLRALRSVHVWAAMTGHVCGDFGAYVMLTCLPSFMSDVLKFELTSLGFLASIPYIVYFLVIQAGGLLADAVLQRGWLSVVWTRRTAMLVSLGAQGAFLVGAGYCGCGQELLVVGLLTIGMGLSGFQYSGFIVNYMDLAPLFSGQLVGVGNTLSCISGILAPVVMAAMTPHKTAEEWRGLFWLTAGVLWGGAIFFSVFASGQLEPWATPHGHGDDQPQALPLMDSKDKDDKPNKTAQP